MVCPQDFCFSQLNICGKETVDKVINANGSLFSKGDCLKRETLYRYMPHVLLNTGIFILDF